MIIHTAEVHGFCKGVENAVELCEELLNKHQGEKCYSIGEVVHNASVVDDFKRRGLEVISSPLGHEKGYALVRAHGITPETEAEFVKAGFTIIDGTCRIVARNHRLASEAKGPVIIVGKRGHAEVVSTAAHVRGEYFIVEDVKDIDSLKVGEKYNVIVQTTFSSSVFDLIKKAIKEKGLNVSYVNNICPASLRRREAVRKLCTFCDAIIVIGDKHSANSVELYDIAIASGVKAYLISGAEEVTKEMVNCENLGLTAGASVPFSIIKEVRGKIKSYGSTQ